MSRIKQILFSLSVGLIVFGCSLKDETYDAPDDRIDVRFVIRTGAMTRSDTRANDYSLFENFINDLTIIVLRSDGSGGFVGDQIVPVEDFEPTSSSSVTFTVPMQPGNTKTKLLFIANRPISVGKFLTSHATDFADLNISETDLRTTLIDLATGTGITMTGEVTLDAISPDTATIIDVPLVRTIAKVNIMLKLEPGSLDFVPTDGTIYHSNSLSQVFPNLETLDNPDAPTRILAPSVPTDQPTGYHFGADLYDVDPVTGEFINAYVIESKAATTAEEQLAATCIVIGGSLDGGPVTYYRLDFNSGKDGHPFGQILRNYHYVFNITKITAPGEDDPVTASEKLSSRVVVDGFWDNIEHLGFN